MLYLSSLKLRTPPFHPVLSCVFSVLLAATLPGCTEYSNSRTNGPAAGSLTVEAGAVPDLPTIPDPGLLLLLVTDGERLNNPQLTAWVDAASEEGVRLQPVTDQQFRALGARALTYGGLILPDQLHPIASDALLQAVRDYTSAGGNTLLVYDFGNFALDGNQKPTYPIPKSRLSDLAGVDYALYDMLREKTTAVGPVTAMRSTLRHLEVPPGKSIAYVPAIEFLADAAAAAADSAPVSPSSYVPESTLPLHGRVRSATTPVDVLDTYSGYLLGNLSYSSFVTRGEFRGKVLATSPRAGLVAGLHKVGRGQVLFVNLPLTYLKVVRTDALPMHGFLHYFAYDVLQLAHLSSVPDAVPGLTLNWHLDAFTAQQPTLTLEKLGVFDNGPFSIHMTTGPDAVAIGDGKGWNLNNNPVAQDILRRLAAKGHAIGSHGGWNHDYYGLNASETNRDTFLPYLEMNLNAVTRAISHPLRYYVSFKMSAVAGTPPTLDQHAQSNKGPVDRLLAPPVREYSPPVGNNPTWAMDWLEQQGMVAAYFAGHTGLGPTRQYREGQLRNPGMWVFPVTPAGRYATFEEFQANHVPKQEVIDWYRDSVDFVVRHNTTRMIYMHPNGANVWTDVLLDLLAYAKAQGPERFKWYTMTRLADFMNARQAVSWTEQREAGGVSRFELSHPSSLDEMVWMLPKTRYASRPTSADRSVTVSDRGTHWAVQARHTRKATFTASIVPAYTEAAAQGNPTLKAEP